MQKEFEKYLTPIDIKKDFFQKKPLLSDDRGNCLFTASELPYILSAKSAYKSCVKCLAEKWIEGYPKKEITDNFVKNAVNLGNNMEPVVYQMFSDACHYKYKVNENYNYKKENDANYEWHSTHQLFTCSFMSYTNKNGVKTGCTPDLIVKTCGESWELCEIKTRVNETHIEQPRIDYKFWLQLKFQEYILKRNFPVLFFNQLTTILIQCSMGTPNNKLNLHVASIEVGNSRLFKFFDLLIDLIDEIKEKYKIWENNNKTESIENKYKYLKKLLANSQFKLLKKKIEENFNVSFEFYNLKYQFVSEIES